MARWTDERLVGACLKGNEQAWGALIDRYKNLVFSIPLKYGATREDAADLFQNVWVELLAHLPNLRKPGSLRSWLITVTGHKAFHWKRGWRRRAYREVPGIDPEELAHCAVPRVDLLEEIERAQMLRDAVAGMSERCGQLIRLLFFEQPPLPYLELARRLGLAEGSIGFIRGRCLKQLRKRLEEIGFR